MNAGEFVRSMRRDAGFSQRELARRAGMSQPALAKIESGATLPRFDTLERLATACGRSLALTSPSPQVDPQDWAQAQEILRLTPELRLHRIEQSAKALLELRAAGRAARAIRPA